MVFNSLVFLVFLAIVLLLYYRLGHRGQNAMLIVASYVFYGWWDYRFVGLLLFTTFFDYFCAIWIDEEPRPARRRLLLASSMVVNLGVLCIFKYFNFFAESLQQALSIFGVTLSFPMLHVVLPVGISFYTFLSMSYTIDVYRHELKATHHPTEFMLYVAFFPHLVAGPIVRASVLLPQCQKPRTIDSVEVANGIWLMLLGYVKKVVIADRLAQVVNWGFGGGVPPFADANSWLVLYAFAFQIYGDFSGYSDIARGLSKLMGFELVENFRAPYLVSNPSSFWRNWHMSLSTWLRDYLYIPLGGNRKGRFNTYRNLTITMLLGGLWHGAGAAYLAWGLYHGILLAVQRAWNDLLGATRPRMRLPWPIAGRTELALPGGTAAPLLLAGQQTRSSPGLVNARMMATSQAGGAVESLEQDSASTDCPQGRAPLRSATATTPEHRGSHGAESGELPTTAREMPPGWPARLKQGLLVVLFFHLTCLGWLLFRGGSLPAGVSQLGFIRHYVHTLLIPPLTLQPMAQGILVLGGLSLFLQWRYNAMNRFSQWPTGWQVVGVVGALAAIASLGVFEGAQFIYFKF